MQAQGKVQADLWLRSIFCSKFVEWHEEKSAAELDKKRAKKDAEATGTTVEDEEASKSAAKTFFLVVVILFLLPLIRKA